MLVQYAIHHFVDSWQSDHQQNLRAQQAYNAELNRMFDGIRDYSEVLNQSVCFL